MLHRTFCRRTATARWLLWWEVLKKLVYRSLQFLYVLIRIVRKRVGGRASPNQIFALGVEEVADEGARLVGLRSRGCPAKSVCPESPPAPSAPTTAEAVVKSVHGVMAALHFDRHDRYIAARIGFSLGPALLC